MKKILEEWKKFVNEVDSGDDDALDPSPEARAQRRDQARQIQASRRAAIEYVEDLLRQESFYNSVAYKVAAGPQKGRMIIGRDELPDLADKINGLGIEGLSARYTDGRDVASFYNPRMASMTRQVLVNVPNNDRRVQIMTREDSYEPSAVVGTLAIY